MDNLDPAHAELLAKAKAATPGPWAGVPLTEQCDRDYLEASHPAAIIDIITLLGEARAELAGAETMRHALEYITKIHNELGLDAREKLLRVTDVAGGALAARGTAAGGGTKHD